MPEKETEQMSFEEALHKLEELTEKMERGELTLEESLKSFEEGIQLTSHCRKLLAEAEYKVEKLLQTGEKTEFEEFTS